MSHHIAHFFNDQNQCIAWPAKPKKQRLLLQFLAEQFAWKKEYTEKEVNELLNKIHTFKDPALLRRELYMKHFLDRKVSGSAYWRTGPGSPP